MLVSYDYNCLFLTVIRQLTDISLINHPSPAKSGQVV